MINHSIIHPATSRHTAGTGSPPLGSSASLLPKNRGRSGTGYQGGRPETAEANTPAHRRKMARLAVPAFVPQALNGRHQRIGVRTLFRPAMLQKTQTAKLWCQLALMNELTLVQSLVNTRHSVLDDQDTKPGSEFRSQDKNKLRVNP